MEPRKAGPQLEPAESRAAAEEEPAVFICSWSASSIVLVIVGAFTLLQRRTQYQALAKETEKLAVPTVAVIHPIAEPAKKIWFCHPRLQAYVESPIYARTNGYLKKWYHDIGSRVQQGELLADIDTPEVDQQLSQARADLGTSQANANLSKITATRYRGT